MKKVSPLKKVKSRGIVAWPEGERPRERLLRQGAQSVTDTELVAILLRVGVKGTSAVELARQILKNSVHSEEWQEFLFRHFWKLKV